VSRARLSLHLIALLLPFAAAATFALMIDRDEELVLRQSAIFGGVGALSAQIAALLRWRALDRRALEGHGGWITGVGMAAITHALFGILFVIGLAFAVGWQKSADSPFDFVWQAIFFIAASVLPLGTLTFPLTAGLAEVVARMRHRELLHVVV
jgi:hypothetical protein